MILIGITGYRRSGKDTVAQILDEHYGFRRYAFAEALRGMARAIDPMIDVTDAPHAVRVQIWRTLGHGQAYRYTELLDALSYHVAKDLPDLRRFLQRLGTEGVRATFGPTAWVDALERTIWQAHGAARDVRLVISDVRFPEEVAWVRSRGGRLWRVTRPGIGGDDTHASETTIAHLTTDRTIDNSGTMGALSQAVLVAAQQDFPQLSL